MFWLTKVREREFFDQSDLAWVGEKECLDLSSGEGVFWPEWGRRSVWTWEVEKECFGLSGGEGVFGLVWWRRSVFTTSSSLLNWSKSLQRAYRESKKRNIKIVYYTLTLTVNTDILSDIKILLLLSNRRKWIHVKKMKKSSPPEEFVTSSITIFENKIACQRILSFPIIFLFIGCCVGGQNEGGWRGLKGTEGCAWRGREVRRWSDDTQSSNAKI